MSSILYGRDFDRETLHYIADYIAACFVLLGERVRTSRVYFAYYIICNIARSHHRHAAHNGEHLRSALCIMQNVTGEKNIVYFIILLLYIYTIYLSPRPAKKTRHAGATITRSLRYNLTLCRIHSGPPPSQSTLSRV